MVVQSLPRPLTFEDLEKIEDRRHRYEILQGPLVVSASSTPLHVWIASRLGAIAVAHVLSHNLGVFFGSPVDVRLSPFDIVEPDLCYVANGRAHIVGDRLIDGAPDLVIEILSPSTKKDDLVRKMALYLLGGVAEYWVVDPDSRSVRILVSREGSWDEVPADSAQIRGRVLPDLVLTAADIFPARA